MGVYRCCEMAKPVFQKVHRNSRNDRFGTENCDDELRNPTCTSSLGATDRPSHRRPAGPLLARWTTVCPLEATGSSMSAIAFNWALGLDGSRVPARCALPPTMHATQRGLIKRSSHALSAPPPLSPALCLSLNTHLRHAAVHAWIDRF